MHLSKKQWYIITAVLIAAACVSGYLFLRQLFENHRIETNNARYRELRSEDMLLGDVEHIPSPDFDTAYFGMPTMPPELTGYDRLLSANEDVIGWLTAGEDIDLPVVFREFDNDTYLTTDLDGKKSDAGTLFMDGWNRVWPADTITVIYGHNMKSGAMFGHLDRYASADYLKRNAILTFGTLYENTKYIPFAACFTDPADLELRQFQPDVDGFNTLIDEVTRISKVECGIDVRYGDRILALVTCTSSNDSKRFVLFCRALRENETEEDVVDLIEQSAK